MFRDPGTIITPDNQDMTAEEVYNREILPALGKAKELSNKWHKKIDIWRKYYNSQQASKDVDAPEYPDPTPLNVTDLAVGAILAKGIEWKAMGFTPSPEEERRSSQIEKYIAGTLEIAMEREEVHLPYEVVLNFCRDGAGVIYSVWDPALAEEHREIRQIPHPSGGPPLTVEIYNESPITTLVIDPKKMHLLPGGPKRWAWVFREEVITVYDFEQLFQMQIPQYDYLTEEQKREQTGTLLDSWRYYDKKVPLGMNKVLGQMEMGSKRVVQRCLSFDNRVVWPLSDMPGYDDIPYKIGFFKPVNKDNPEQWGHGIIEPMLPTLQFLERSINRRMHQIDVYTSMPMIVRAMAGRDVEIDPGFGNYEVLEPDEDITWPTWPGNSPDIEEQIGFFRARLQQSGFTDLMYGSSTGDAAGYAINQLTDQNRIRLIQPVKHLELLWSRWARHILKLTRSFAPNAVVRVYGSIKGEDFVSQMLGEDCADYLINARLQTQFPNDPVRNHAMGTQASPFLSLHTLLEKYFDIDQPDDEIKRKMQEQAMLMPAMQQFLITETLVGEAKAGNMAAGLVLQQMYGQGGGDPNAAAPGRPTEQIEPEQPLGLQSSTGEAVPQAAGGEPAGQSAQDLANQLAEAAPGMDGTI